MSNSPNPTDRHVGSRVRMRRLMLDMSQTALGDALGLTFQQVQKYEKGTNRISASRLQQMAHILQVPVLFFFDGLPSNSTLTKGKTAAQSQIDVDEFVASSVGLSLTRAFMRIKNQKLRSAVVRLVENLAGLDRQ
jgi:transcriptional regulator with XRE-family HTH domain